MLEWSIAPGIMVVALGITAVKMLGLADYEQEAGIGRERRDLLVKRRLYFA
jgi:hypothetical protein